MRKALGVLLLSLPVGFLVFVMGEQYGYLDTLIGIALGFGLTTAGILGLALLTE